MDREATPEDFKALRAFATSRVGVELFVEPETMVTDTTVVAVATDGEWTRRRAGSPDRARKLARDLRIPIYDVQIVGYPQRMRDYNKRLKQEGRKDRMLPEHHQPPVRTQRPPDRIPRPRRPEGDR